MATKNISITEEAYRRLTGLKESNESFSEIIVKLTGKKDISKFFGILSEDSANDLKSNISLLREKSRGLRKSRAEKIKELFQ